MRRMRPRSSTGSFDIDRFGRLIGLESLDRGGRQPGLTSRMSDGREGVVRFERIPVFGDPCRRKALPQVGVVDHPSHRLGQPVAAPVEHEGAGVFVENPVERWEVRNDDRETDGASFVGNEVVALEPARDNDRPRLRHPLVERRAFESSGDLDAVGDIVGDQDVGKPFGHWLECGGTPPVFADERQAQVGRRPQEWHRGGHEVVGALDLAEPSDTDQHR